MSDSVFKTTDYSDKNFEKLRSRLRNLVQTVFPDWDKDASASFGNILLDAFAFVGDISNFYSDAQSREAFVRSATLLSSMLAFSEQYGIHLPMQTAATVDLTFTLPNVYSYDVTIPAGTIVETGGNPNVIFQLQYDTVIPSGDLTAIGTAENSLVINENIIVNSVSWFEGWLTRTDFLEIIKVVDDAGDEWYQVDSLIDSTPEDRHFEVRLNSAGRAKLKFGDGILGKVPEFNLTVQYKVGGGKVGNVAANTLVNLTEPIYSAGSTISVSVTNTSPASGGTDGISVDQARLYIPASFRTQNRTVSNQDFVDNALQVTGVARALMLTSNEDSGIPENMGYLIIIPEGGGNPSQAMKDAVYTMVTETKPCPVTFQVLMLDPIYKNIDIKSSIQIEEGYDPSDVAVAIRERLAELFYITRETNNKSTFVKFGGEYKNRFGVVEAVLPYSVIYDIVNDTEGVRKLKFLTINGINGDVALRPIEFPFLHSVTLVDGDTGNTL